LSCGSEQGLHAHGEKVYVGIWLTEVLRDGKPTGQYIRTTPGGISACHIYAKQIAKPTPFYIVQPEAPETEWSLRDYNAMQSQPFLFDYASLLNDTHLEENTFWTRV